VKLKKYPLIKISNFIEGNQAILQKKIAVISPKILCDEGIWCCRTNPEIPGFYVRREAPMSHSAQICATFPGPAKTPRDPLFLVFIMTIGVIKIVEQCSDFL